MSWKHAIIFIVYAFVVLINIDVLIDAVKAKKNPADIQKPVMLPDVMNFPTDRVLHRHDYIERFRTATPFEKELIMSTYRVLISDLHDLELYCLRPVKDWFIKIGAHVEFSKELLMLRVDDCRHSHRNMHDYLKQKYPGELSISSDGIYHYIGQISTFDTLIDVATYFIVVNVFPITGKEH